MGKSATFFAGLAVIALNLAVLNYTKDLTLWTVIGMTCGMMLIYKWAKS